MEIYSDYIVKTVYIDKKDGRYRVYLYKYKESIVISYPKYLMEKHLGRYLTGDETVHHIDEDFTNNVISNLEVLTRSEHTILHMEILKTQ